LSNLSHGLREPGSRGGRLGTRERASRAGPRRAGDGLGRSDASFTEKLPREAVLRADGRPFVASPSSPSNRHNQPNSSRENELRAAFKLSPRTQSCSQGPNRIRRLKRWWRYEGGGSPCRHCRASQAWNCLVTTPNYSLFANVPRWDDLHSDEADRLGLLRVFWRAACGGVACQRRL